MAPRYRIDLSWGGGLSARDLPWSRSELSAVAQATLQAVRSEARVRAAAERLGPALERLSLLVCSDEEMRNFQKSFRRVDRSTDVLSFPTLELPAAELDLIPKAELSLGDLVVSLPAVVRERAVGAGVCGWNSWRS